jgi:hypothetical protein
MVNISDDTKIVRRRDDTQSGPFGLIRAESYRRALAAQTINCFEQLGPINRLPTTHRSRESTAWALNAGQ